MVYRFKDRLWRFWFSCHCKNILLSPPIGAKQDAVKIVSMVSHKDVLMYLLAVKSFCHRIRGGQVIVINDGSLTVNDIKLLANHLPGHQLLNAHAIRSPFCPNGGTWERLLVISELAQENYVIQIDSDTLTLNDIKEVETAITANRSFTLGTAMGRAISPMSEVCGQMRTIRDSHIQVLAEQHFCNLQNYKMLRYVRGCSGFAGFARGSLDRAKLEAFSREMQKIVGAKWSRWGSEQVASNVFIANAPATHVLPYPKYANFTPSVVWQDSCFLHFIGSYRFRQGVYIQKAREIVKRLKKSEAQPLKLLS